MALYFRLEDYGRYQQAVGGATCVDVTRRTDPARIPQVWDNLRAVADTYGPPWVVQLFTKDPAGLLARGGALLAALRAGGSTLAAHVTVTGLAGTHWEPRVPGDAVAALGDLVAALGGADHIKWRYDPIMPTVHAPERFDALAGRVAAAGIRQAVINFVAPPGRYARVDRRLGALLPGWAEGMPGYDEAWRRDVAADLVARAAPLGLRLSCCAESAGLATLVPGLGHAACGDHDWFVRLSGRDPGRVAYAGSRPGCGCTRYFDVGVYGRWARCHGCVYCYAG